MIPSVIAKIRPVITSINSRAINIATNIMYNHSFCKVNLNILVSDKQTKINNIKAKALKN